MRMLMVIVWGVIFSGSAWAGDKVVVVEIPGGGKQPRAVIDAKGTVHLVYLKGESNVYYAKLTAGEDGWSEPVRVNSQAGSAVAVGTIRGPQLAVGKGGRVHVVWNGSWTALPKGPANPALPKSSKYRLSTPFLYTHLQDDGSGFEKQRSLLQSTYSLDGGGAVAADDKGNVYAFWHANKGGKGEGARSVWVRLSKDGGKSFSKEKRISKKGNGVCACCGMGAFIDSKGSVYAFFRAATKGVNRDMTLLTTKAGSKKFKSKTVHKWKLQACPMSSASISEGADKTILAWETSEQVYFASAGKLKERIAAPGNGKRKHPVAVRNSAGETILVWAENTGWKRGGNLHWQVFDANNRPTQEAGSKPGGIAVWGAATVIARQDGTFLVIH